MKVITISREYGAGGHSIGQQVAKQLGIAFYDRDIIEAAAKASGIDPAQIAQEEEQLSRADPFLRPITPISYDQKDVIFDYEKAAIIQIAAQGPCVILGRCADTILPEAGIPSLDVFITADDDHRAVRTGELLELTDPADIQKAMKKTDHARRSYYTQYTGKRWGEAGNYDLVVDSGSLGYELCIQLICAAAQNG